MTTSTSPLLVVDGPAAVLQPSSSTSRPVKKCAVRCLKLLLECLLILLRKNASARELHQEVVTMLLDFLTASVEGQYVLSLRVLCIAICGWMTSDGGVCVHPLLCCQIACLVFSVPKSP